MGLINFLKLGCECRRQHGRKLLHGQPAGYGGDHQTCPGSPGGNLGSEKQLLRIGREMKLKTEISLRAICRTSTLIGSIVVRSQGRQRMSGKTGRLASKILNQWTRAEVDKLL